MAAFGMSFTLKDPKIQPLSLASAHSSLSLLTLKPMQPYLRHSSQHMRNNARDANVLKPCMNFERMW